MLAYHLKGLLSVLAGVQRAWWLLAMSLWCQYVYEVLWYESLPRESWNAAVRALCL